MSRTLDGLAACTAAELRALAASVAAPTPCAVLAGRVVAVLPFGPGALAPAAWIAAASRLGAGVVRASDLEPPAGDEFDAALAAARWADILVVSHPLNGFARAVGDLTGRAVVNAGEDGGEDPAGGLSLLGAALGGVTREGASPGLRAAICGDLAGSRSARSLLVALATLQATLLLVPAQGRDLPDPDLDRIARRMHSRPFRFEAHSMTTLLDMVDTVLLAPDVPPQLPLFREVGVPPGDSERRARRDVEDLDVLVVAGERGADRLVHEPFRGRRRSGLPAGAEHVTSLRALEVALEFAATAPPPSAPAGAPTRYRSGLGVACRAERCAAARRSDRVTQDFDVESRHPCELVCRFCGARRRAGFAASKVEGRFHAIGSAYAGNILDANLVLFETAAEALAAGFEPARRGSEEAGETP